MAGRHDRLQGLHEHWVLLGQLLQLVIDVLGGALVQQGFSFTPGFKALVKNRKGLLFKLPVVKGVVDKAHVNVDCMDVWDTVLHPHRLPVQRGALQRLHRCFCLLRRVKLHQPPLLEYSMLLGNLAIWWADHCCKELSKLGQVPECRGKVVDVEDLAVKRGESVGSLFHPLAVNTVPSNLLALEHMACLNNNFMFE